MDSGRLPDDQSRSYCSGTGAGGFACGAVSTGAWGLRAIVACQVKDLRHNGLMADFDRITWNPMQLNGQPCIRGMRITVRRVVEAVSIYPDRGDLFRNYPELDPEDIRQALAFAAANLEDGAAEFSAA